MRKRGYTELIEAPPEMPLAGPTDYLRLIERVVPPPTLSTAAAEPLKFDVAGPGMTARLLLDGRLEDHVRNLTTLRGMVDNILETVKTAPPPSQKRVRRVAPSADDSSAVTLLREQAQRMDAWSKEMVQKNEELRQKEVRGQELAAYSQSLMGQLQTTQQALEQSQQRLGATSQVADAYAAALRLVTEQRAMAENLLELAQAKSGGEAGQVDQLLTEGGDAKGNAELEAKIKTLEQELEKNQLALSEVGLIRKRATENAKHLMRLVVQNGRLKQELQAKSVQLEEALTKTMATTTLVDDEESAAQQNRRLETLQMELEDIKARVDDARLLLERGDTAQGVASQQAVEEDFLRVDRRLVTQELMKLGAPDVLATLRYISRQGVGTEERQEMIEQQSYAAPMNIEVMDTMAEANGLTVESLSNAAPMDIEAPDPTKLQAAIIRVRATLRSWAVDRLRLPEVQEKVKHGLAWWTLRLQRLMTMGGLVTQSLLALGRQLIIHAGPTARRAALTVHSTLRAAISWLFANLRRGGIIHDIIMGMAALTALTAATFGSVTDLTTKRGPTRKTIQHLKALQALTAELSDNDDAVSDDEGIIPPVGPTGVNAYGVLPPPPTLGSEATNPPAPAGTTDRATKKPSPPDNKKKKDKEKDRYDTLLSIIAERDRQPTPKKKGSGTRADAAEDVLEMLVAKDPKAAGALKKLTGRQVLALVEASHSPELLKLRASIRGRKKRREEIDRAILAHFRAT